jgi:hypothetical protein
MPAGLAPAGKDPIVTKTELFRDSSPSKDALGDITYHRKSRDAGTQALTLRRIALPLAASAAVGAGLRYRRINRNFASPSASWRGRGDASRSVFRSARYRTT